MKFCDRLLETVQPVWEKSHNHPFVVGMGNGKLEKINSNIILYKIICIC